MSPSIKRRCEEFMQQKRTMDLLNLEFPKQERFPDNLLVKFEESEYNGLPRVSISIDGNRVGDYLTDNSYFDDGYRYHDVFHFSYAAILHWSPCLRSLLKCKRKSSPMVDEVEDGGRAKVTEEAISLLVFSYLKSRRFFIEKGNIEPKLLEIIQSLVTGLEVSNLSSDYWERAILCGVEAFIHLKNNKGGYLYVNTHDGILSYLSHI